MSQSFHDHFSSFAKRYADFRPHYPAALFDYLATLAPRTSTVWDCACGNGQATVDLAERFDKVVATDASREQIASATPHPNVEYRVAPAEQSRLPDESVALVTVAQAVHWFDLDRFYAEVKRVLRPDGRLIVWAYGTTQIEEDAANQLVQDFYSNIVGPYWPPGANSWRKVTGLSRFRSERLPRQPFAWKRAGPSTSCSAISAPGRRQTASSKPPAKIRWSRFRRRWHASGVMPIPVVQLSGPWR